MVQRVNLAFGRNGLIADFPDHAHIVEPKELPGLADETDALRQSLLDPIGTAPLPRLLRGRNSVVIVINDVTRPVPTERILPPLLEHLRHLPRERILILNALGLHRPNTPEELASMVGPGVYAEFGDRIINHNAFDPDSLIHLGATSRGTPVWVNRAYMEADFKILTGFIEPHFFAGFSGGRKVVVPGVAGAATVLANHNVANIDHPAACYGELNNNPIHLDLAECADKAGADFIVNVAINKRRAITGVWSGDMHAAHAAGAEFVRRNAMVAVPGQFDFVVTTNSGYPLDMNLYQTVKGMSAGALILKPGGILLMAGECSDGIGKAFYELLTSRPTPQALLEMIRTPGWSAPEQWQVQILANLLTKYSIHVHAPALEPDKVRACHLNPVADLSGFIAQHATGSVAVLPQGPMTIPYL